MFTRGCILLLEHHIFKLSVNLWDWNTTQKMSIACWLGFEPEINPSWIQENQADMKKCTLVTFTV